MPTASKKAEGGRLNAVDALAALFRRERPPLDVRPPPFVIHRLLAGIAADPESRVNEMTQVARQVGQHVRDPAMVWEVWCGAIPAGMTGAPKFKWVGAKRPAEPDDLVCRIMEVEGYNRDDAEMAVQVIEDAGRVIRARTYYGVED